MFYHSHLIWCFSSTSTNSRHFLKNHGGKYESHKFQVTHTSTALNTLTRTSTAIWLNTGTITAEHHVRQYLYYFYALKWFYTLFYIFWHLFVCDFALFYWFLYFIANWQSCIIDVWWLDTTVNISVLFFSFTQIMIYYNLIYCTPIAVYATNELISNKCKQQNVETQKF